MLSNIDNRRLLIFVTNPSALYRNIARFSSLSAVAKQPLTPEPDVCFPSSSSHLLLCCFVVERRNGELLCSLAQLHFHRKPERRKALSTHLLILSLAVSQTCDLPIAVLCRSHGAAQLGL